MWGSLYGRTQTARGESRKEQCGLFGQEWLICDKPRPYAEHMIVREIAATPVDVLLVANLGIDGQRS
jgi:hypothetical protein